MSSNPYIREGHPTDSGQIFDNCFFGSHDKEPERRRELEQNVREEWEYFSRLPGAISIVCGYDQGGTQNIVGCAQMVFVTKKLWIYVNSKKDFMWLNQEIIKKYKIHIADAPEIERMNNEDGVIGMITRFNFSSKPEHMGIINYARAELSQELENYCKGYNFNIIMAEVIGDEAESRYSEFGMQCLHRFEDAPNRWESFVRREVAAGQSSGPRLMYIGKQLAVENPNKIISRFLLSAKPKVLHLSRSLIDLIWLEQNNYSNKEISEKLGIKIESINERWNKIFSIFRDNGISAGEEADFEKCKKIVLKHIEDNQQEIRPILPIVKSNRGRPSSKK